MSAPRIAIASVPSIDSTVAERRSPSSIAISPKMSPGAEVSQRDRAAIRMFAHRACPAGAHDIARAPPRPSLNTISPPEPSRHSHLRDAFELSSGESAEKTGTRCSKAIVSSRLEDIPRMHTTRPIASRGCPIASTGLPGRLDGVARAPRRVARSPRQVAHRGGCPRRVPERRGGGAEPRRRHTESSTCSRRRRFSAEPHPPHEGDHQADRRERCDRDQRDARPHRQDPPGVVGGPAESEPAAAVRGGRAARSWPERDVHLAVVDRMVAGG